MQDDQLIFMISLPRSGSTMLQKIIGSHSQVYTRSEPWLMLHPLHALKSSDIHTPFNAQLAEGGLRDFISGLPKDGIDCYYKRIQSCYLDLYNQYLKSNHKTRFLDKTPRYYSIFDELQLTFPQAKFIIIYRNPLAVLSSMLHTWVKGDFKKLVNYKADLEQGIDFLLRDFSRYENTHLIRYESLIKNPHNSTNDLFDFLQLEPEPECINYRIEGAEKWKYGDPNTVYEKGTPDASNIDGWHVHLKDPATFKLTSDYLEKLGKESFNRLGYNYDAAKQVLDLAHQEYMHPQVINISLAESILSNEEMMAAASTKKDQQIDILTEKLGVSELKTRELLSIAVDFLRDFELITATSIKLSPIKKLRSYKALLNTYSKHKKRLKAHAS